MDQILLYGWILLYGCLCSIPAAGQSHNGQLYQRLLHAYLTDIDTTIKGVNGVVDPSFLPTLSLDTVKGVLIELSEPEIVYEKLAPKLIKRTISFSTRYKARQPILGSQTLSDTLTMEQIKRIYKESPKALRGDKPTVTSKWVRPALLITLSISAIISLFFISS